MMILHDDQLRSLGLAMYLTLPCGCDDAGYIIGKSIQANGLQRYTLVCNSCGHSCGGAIAPAKLPPHVRAAAPLISNNIDAKVRCARCGSNAGVELHHWAPMSRFDDFDQWPTAPLCIACHMKWHRKMNGYVWQQNLRRSSSR
jgi:hypothetical protein